MIYAWMVANELYSDALDLVILTFFKVPKHFEILTKPFPYLFYSKVKTYEEQELTMQVASELDHSNGSVDIGVDDDDEEVNYIEEEDEDGEEGDNNVVTSIHHHNHHLNKRQRNQSPQFSHAYATLHPQPRGMGQADNYDNINILGEDTIAVHL